MSATSPRLPRRRRLVALGAAATLVLVLGACGGGDDENVVADAQKDESLPTLMTTAPPTTLPSAKGKECVAPVDVPEAEGKPTVEMPVGEVPTELVKTDITVGDGKEAVLDKTIKVQYVGIACSTGKQFDASWDRGEPTEFPLTAGGLIDGWIEGIPGMKVGGRRQLVIPSGLAYGEAGQPPDIAPDEALVFVIDLVDVLDAPSTTLPAEPPADGSSTTVAEGGSTTTVTDDATTTTAEAE